MDNDRYLTVKEVSKLLGVCRSSIYEWMKNGEFPKQTKFGSSSRWPLQKIKKWAKNRPKGAYGEG